MDTLIDRKSKAIQFKDTTEDGNVIILKVLKLPDENGGVLLTMRSTFYDGDDQKPIYGQIALSREEAEDLMLELSDMLHFCETRRDNNESNFD